MAIFPGFSTQDPILSVFESSGNFSKSIFFSFEIVSKFKLSGLNLTNLLSFHFYLIGFSFPLFQLLIISFYNLILIKLTYHPSIA